MIDARAWTRPSPDEIRAMVESLRKGRSMKDTTIEISARLGMRSRRAVFHWMSPKQEPGREIGYCEWYLLNEIVKEHAAGGVRMATKHPNQPIEVGPDGVARFKMNAIVRYLLDAGPFDMNSLSLMPFSDEDRVQFAQLIGYSLSGFSELYYVGDEAYDEATAEFDG